MWDLKIKTATVYLSPGLDLHATHKVRSEVKSVTVSGVKSPGGHPEDLALTTRIHTGHLHSSPSLTYTQTHIHTHTGFGKGKGWHVCLGKGVLNVKFAYTVTPPLSSNKGMLAPVLLHLYSEEVRSKFCCLILQLIANRMSSALLHTATCRQPEHPMQLCKHKHHSLKNGMFTGQNRVGKR